MSITFKLKDIKRVVAYGCSYTAGMELADADIGLSPVGGQTKKIKQLSVDIAKQQNQNQSAPVVVDAKQITTDNSSSNMTTGSTSVRNSNPFISAYANSSDFSFG